MSRERARRALQLFEEALNLEPEELAAFLDEACAGNAELRHEVESLIASNSEATDMFPSRREERDDSSGPPRLDLNLDDSHLLEADTLLAGRYQIIALIGSGGMGDVYRAVDRRLDRDVAIKTLKHAGLQNRELRDRFDREMRSVASLSHANIVTLYDVVEHGELTFAVMEFVHGKTLGQFMTDNLEWQQTANLARDVALGLAAAHELNMMHRDIKPDNVIVTEERRAKVLDFGLARPEVAQLDQAITVGNLMAGTIPYMSPEQAESQELTCSTDIFSLGTILYEMLSGAHPFRTDSALTTLRRVADADPTPLQTVVTKIPDEFAVLVMQMLSKSPEQRPTARQVADRLSANRLSAMGERLQESVSLSANETVESAPRATRVSRWQPSLIVLPFQTFGNDTELDSISDGLVENLTTVLTRIPMLSITSRVSSFSMKGLSTTANEVRQRFGVDYMIEGSLQRFGDQLRVNVQLIDTAEGFHLWAQQFDGDDDAEAVTHLLNQILQRLEPQLVRAIFNSLRDESGELNGRQLLVQSMTVLSLKGWHQDSFSEVAQLLQKSIELEPELALSHAYLALIRGLGKRVGLVADPETAVRDTVEHAEIALDLDDMDSNVLGLAGCAFSDIGQTRRGIPILRRAIEMNPNNAQAHAALGAAHLMDRDFEQAIHHLQVGVDLSPLDGRLAVWYALLAIAHLQSNDIEKAYAAAVLGCQSDRKTYMPHVVLTAVNILRGQTKEAIQALQETLRVKPDLSQEETNLLIGRELGIALRKLRRESAASNDI